MNYLALVSIAIKYVPIVINFVQTNDAEIKEFVAEVEAALGAAQPTALAAPQPSLFQGNK